MSQPAIYSRGGGGYCVLERNLFMASGEKIGLFCGLGAAYVGGVADYIIPFSFSQEFGKVEASVLVVVLRVI